MHAKKQQIANESNEKHKVVDRGVQWTSHSEDETRQFGQWLADCCVAGTVVALVGELGAGKTRLVQAFAERFGVDRREVSSPTFVLIHEYDGPIPIYHIDAYRLRDADEFLDLGVEELMSDGGICLIEWANRVTEALPTDMVIVDIAITGSETRGITVRSTGERSSTIVQCLSQRIVSRQAEGDSVTAT